MGLKRKKFIAQSICIYCQRKITRCDRGGLEFDQISDGHRCDEESWVTNVSGAWHTCDSSGKAGRHKPDKLTMLFIKSTGLSPGEE